MAFSFYFKWFVIIIHYYDDLLPVSKAHTPIACASTASYFNLEELHKHQTHITTVLLTY